VLQMNCNLQYLQELVGSWHCHRPLYQIRYLG
jgi:hypothetical protein